MVEKILSAFQKWKSDPRFREPYTLTWLDRKMAVVAAEFTEKELRHALVMRAAYERECEKLPNFSPKLPSPTPPQGAA